MNTITLTAYNRPDYLREVVSSLNACLELRHFTVYVGLEPSKQDYAAYRILSEMGTGLRVKLNDSVIGSCGNVLATVCRAFDAGSEFNLNLDDDCVVSPDALRLALWFKDSANTGDTDDFHILELFSRNKSELANPADIEQHPTFNPLGWACSREVFRKHLVQAWNRKDDDGKPLLYCQGMHRVMRENLLTALRPKLSRSKNIGRSGGTHDTPEYFDLHYQGFNFNSKPYDGPYMIV